MLICLYLLKSKTIALLPEDKDILEKTFNSLICPIVEVQWKPFFHFVYPKTEKLHIILGKPGPIFIDMKGFLDDVESKPIEGLVNAYLVVGLLVVLIVVDEGEEWEAPSCVGGGEVCFWGEEAVG